VGLSVLPEGRQARDRRAVGLVGGRLFLHLGPSRVGILFIPGLTGFRVKCSLRDQIVERATMILQIEDTILRIEIEICAVQLAAMRQASGNQSECLSPASFHPGFRGVGTVYRSGAGIGASDMGGTTGAGDDGGAVGVGLRAEVAMGRGGGGAEAIFARISLLEVCSVSMWCAIWS